ncbi:ABZJ_00895 family protein [Gordonia sp. LSe1-13]|uniref:ABZJ_00895 family protein n=1 Tax=Gordonia sesuvii TaxID=3116777 RepID=A0ABU7MGG9_9ACTN|nr:ABZJ_00895 family protein [Gordonia sp. LSe1-13]
MSITAMSLGKYLGWFAGSYAVLALIVGAIGEFIDIGSGASVIVPMLAAMLAGDRFVADHERLPSKAEKSALIYGSFAISIVLAAITLAVMVVAIPDLTTEVEDSLGWPLTIGILAVGFALNYLLIWFGYGPMTKRMLASRERKLERQG